MPSRPSIVVAGEICVDLPIRPIDHSKPLAELHHLRVDAIQPGGGGIVANCAVALARLGAEVAAYCYVGDDPWADILIEFLQSNQVTTERLKRIGNTATTVTAVIVDTDGEHTFAYHPGASHHLTKPLLLADLDYFSGVEYALFGYYALMPRLESDLPEVFDAIRKTGCRIALDTAGGGGSLSPLDRILPHLDIYIPSREEGMSQTGETDPKAILDVYRRFTNHALLGVKLGAEGALLSPAAGEFLHVDPISPPGEVVDTTGAGDCFYAGMLRALSEGFELEHAGRIAAAAGASAVTRVGATAGLQDFEAIKKLAGV